MNESTSAYNEAATLYYLHDPMCSWCWGYSPTWKMLQQVLPANITVNYVAGGLAPDSDEPMPIAQQQMIENHWRTIETKLDTQFNYDFWRNNTPRRSTYNSCRAAIAADKQGCQQEMITAIQHGYYLQAVNPSNIDVLIALAKTLTTAHDITFDHSQFCSDLTSEVTEQLLQQQISLARALTQQGFPSLVLEYKDLRYQIPIDYKQYQPSLMHITAIINGRSPN